jgi:hypothetical protein
MRFNHVVTGFALSLALGSFASADTLQLRNGKMLTGKYAGGAAGTINFQTSEGMKVIDTGQAASLTFSAPPPPVATPAPARATTTTTTAAPSGAGSVPAGTLLLVRLDSTISSDSAAAGQRFSCKLEADLVANGVVVAPAGTPVYGRVTKGKKAGRLAGKSELELQLSEINLGGQTVALVTSNYAQAGQGEFRSTARNAAIGAGVGAAFDGGDGAAKGAAIGGAVSLLKKGEAVTLPAGSLLEFRLTGALQVQGK